MQGVVVLGAERRTRTNKGREATETEGLVYLFINPIVVCVFVCPDCIKVIGEYNCIYNRHRE